MSDVIETGPDSHMTLDRLETDDEARRGLFVNFGGEIGAREWLINLWPIEIKS